MEKPKSWVYFIQEGTDGPIKIGFTGSPRGRLAALPVCNAKPLRIVAQCPGSSEDEKRFHGRFSHLRIIGEWFRPADDLLEAISGFRGADEEEALDDDGNRARLECGLDRMALQDIADFIDAQRLHRAAYRLARATEKAQELPPVSLAERLDALADEMRDLYCGGGHGIEMFGRAALASRGHDLLALAEKIREGHARKVSQETN